MTIQGYKNLTSITIPDSVTSIGSSAFSGCSGLTSVTIPDSVTSIGSAPFSNCSCLTTITVDANNPNFTNDERGVLFNKDKTELIQYPVGNTAESYDIPDSVTSIGEGVFYGCSSLTSVTIPDSVTSIGSSAFNGCSGLTSVIIPDSVTSIGRGAFRGCSGLTSVTISDGVASIGGYTFYGCSGLTSVTIPDGVTSIGGSAFRGCSSLTSVTIPDSVTSIGYRAFDGCSSLTSVTIPDSVTSIGDNAFDGCYRLKDVYYTGTKDEWDEIKIESYNSYLTLATIHYQATVLFPFVSQTADETVYTVKTANLPDGVVVVVALYKDGRFVGYENAVCHGDTLTIATAILHDRAVIMAWDGLDTMKPLSPAAKI